MRIKKVSQVAGLVGGVSNTYSESTTDAYSCDYVNDLNTYSTTEQAVGTWINGKPLYRKIVSLTSYTTQTISVFNNSNQRVVKINGCFASTAGVAFMYPDFGANGSFQSTIYMSDYYTLNIVSNRSLSNFDYGYIELLYYKTTD